MHSWETGALEMIDPSDFRARAGTLTLLYVASSVDREVLIRILVNALEGRELPDEDYDEPSAIDQIEIPEIEVVGGDMPGEQVQMQITSAGRELVFVASVLERWLSKAPDRPLQLGDIAGGAALAAFVCGWSATIVHALAGEEARTMDELSQIVDVVSYETLQDHVEALERTGLVARQDNGSSPGYAATRWLREAIAPLAAAARLELRNPAEDTAPIDALDVAAGFMLSLPLVEAPTDLSGTCRLGVELDDGAIASAVARIEPGRPTAAELDIDPEESGTWATASVADWLDTIIEPDAKRVRTGGDRLLASALVNGLHRALFGAGAL